MMQCSERAKRRGKFKLVGFTASGTRTAARLENREQREARVKQSDRVCHQPALVVPARQPTIANTAEGRASYAITAPACAHKCSQSAALSSQWQRTADTPKAHVSEMAASSTLVAYSVPAARVLGTKGGSGYSILVAANSARQLTAAVGPETVLRG
jgi:hypothetical protein